MNGYYAKVPLRLREAGFVPQPQPRKEEYILTAGLIFQQRTL